MDIKTLLDRQLKLEESFQNEFFRKIRTEILKHKLDARPEKLVKNIVKKHVKAGVRLGTEWINT